MGIGSRKEYLAAIRERYRTAGRHAKTAILDEFCANCEYNRKYAIRLLGQRRRRTPRRRGPTPSYDGPVVAHLKALWRATDQMCGKRLVRAIPEWLPFYEMEYGTLDPVVRAKLLTLSPATCDRLLAPVRARLKVKGKCTTRPGRLLRSVIPIRPDKATMDRPGFIEADTVAHCGNSLEGQFAWSITYTDIQSGWTDNRAVWGHGAAAVVEQTRAMEASLAFPIIAFWSDNGTEFLNDHLWRYFAHRHDPIHFARSRPYKKDDNAHVEQKNWTHVRQLLGYDRIDRPELVPAMNEIYRLWGLYQNHWAPARRLQSKTRINSKWVKKYDAPKTPYQPAAAGLNPFRRKKDIEKRLRRLFNDLWTHEP